MELELGLKITHGRDDLTSSADLRLNKDPSGPLFVSKETDTMFILVAHLKGFRRENIDVEINKDGDRIAISGEVPVQEMVLRNWVMHKREAVVRRFRKIFRIPEGVILDKIKAKFSSETLTLTIRMPKLEKGISGVRIEEVDEEETEKVPESGSLKEDVDQESKQPPEMGNFDQVETGQPQVQGVVADEVPERSTKIPEGDGDEELVKEKPEETKEDIESRKLEDTAEAEPVMKSKEEIDQIAEKPLERTEIEQQPVTGNVELPSKTETSSMEPEEEAQREADQVTQESEFPSSSSTPVEELQKQEPCTEDEQLTKPEPHQEPKPDDQTTIKEEVHKEDQNQADEIRETTPTSDENLSQEKANELECRKQEKQISSSEEADQEKKLVPRKSKVCTPIVVAGSAFLVSIIVLVIHFIRAKKR